MSKILIDKKTGLKHRDGTLDLMVIREQKVYMELLKLVKGKTVLDMGGNIGAFAYHAIKFKAKEVFSFEPEPENIKLFKLQELKNVKLIEMAVTSSDDKMVRLYVNGKKNRGEHTLRKVRGREFIKVKTVSFKKVLEKVKPDMIKIDIEGGEYSIDFKLIPKSVKAIAIEIHLSHEREKGIKLLKYLRKEFKEVSETKISSGPKPFDNLIFIGVR